MRLSYISQLKFVKVKLEVLLGGAPQQVIVIKGFKLFFGSNVRINEMNPPKITSKRPIHGRGLIYLVYLQAFMSAKAKAENEKSFVSYC